MALARLALKHVQQRVSSPSSAAAALACSNLRERNLTDKQTKGWGFDMVKMFSEAASDKASDEKSEGKRREVAVSEGGKKSELFPRRQHRRSLWRNRDRDFVPALYEFFPSRLGDALMQASENMSRLFESLAPSRLMGQLRQKDECYKLRYEMPGLAKEDVKITVEDGVLRIKGEHKEEQEEGSNDEFWSSASYGYYDTSLLLPDDAKVDEVKAELKDGVLFITIPRTEKQKKDVKEVQIH